MGPPQTNVVPSLLTFVTYKHNINSMVSVCVSTSGLVPASKCKFQAPELQASVFNNVIELKRNLNTEAFLKLKFRANPLEPRIKAGTLGQAILEQPLAWWTKQS